MIKEINKTFYADYSESDAFDWINNFKSCFQLKSLSLNIYEVKFKHFTEKRVKIKLRYFA
jgi:hypothetical protein